MFKDLVGRLGLVPRDELRKVHWVGVARLALWLGYDIAGRADNTIANKVFRHMLRSSGRRKGRQKREPK